MKKNAFNHEKIKTFFERIWSVFFSKKLTNKNALSPPKKKYEHAFFEIKLKRSKTH